MGIEVGHFTKKTDGTGVQSVSHGLGETPKAIILFGNAKTSTGFTIHILSMFGYSDGVDDACLAWAAQDAVGTSNTARGHKNDKCAVFMDYNANILAEAHLDSWDINNFVLDWTVNNGNAYNIGYILLSGSGVSAKVVYWTTPTSTGNKAVTGVGFSPKALIHLGRNQTIFGTAANLSSCIGIVDDNSNEFALSMYSQDAQTASVAARSIFQKSFHTLSSTTASSEIANHVSMNADGFTNNFTTVLASAMQVSTLCLSGIEVKIGNFTKTTNVSVPVDQAVTGLGFQPLALMFIHAVSTVYDAIAVNLRAGLGIADIDTEFAVHYNDNHGADPTDTDDLVKTDKCLVLSANIPSTIIAEADLKTLDSDGFTLTWTTNNALANKIVYLALSTDTGIVEVREDTSVTDEISMVSVFKTISELASVSDVINVNSDFIEMLESVVIDDQFVVMTGFATIDENVLISDFVKHVTSLVETISVVDNITLDQLKTIAEEIGVADSLANILAYIETNEIISAVDIITRKSLVLDIISFADAVQKNILSKPGEDVSISDSVIVTKKAVNTYKPGNEIIIVPRRQTQFIIDSPKKEN